VTSSNGSRPGTDGTLLEVENLRVGFPVATGRLRAVDGVSLTIARGEALGIVGESGSGKSVLSRSLMRLLPDDAQMSEDSAVAFDGTDVRQLVGAKRPHFLGVQISMVFQDPMGSLTPVVKVGRQITEPLRHHLGMSKREARRRAIELLELVRIPEAASRLDQYPHELSGGMTQRVMIAIALACEPKLLIADEPTTALDVTVQQQVLDLLKDLQVERHMALLLVTHDLGVVAGRTDRVAVMYAGRIVERASTASLLGRTHHPYTEALFGAIPRMSDPSHKRLAVVPGRPPDMSRATPGCSFAPRCRYAQPECLVAPPPERVSPDDPDHTFTCFYPVGTPEGDEALARNQRAGRTAAGRTLEGHGAELTW
jgi:peptide/nickel transport system ATP-binding protein